MRTENDKVAALVATLPSELRREDTAGVVWLAVHDYVTRGLTRSLAAFVRDAVKDAEARDTEELRTRHGPRRNGGAATHQPDPRDAIREADARVDAAAVLARASPADRELLEARFIRDEPLASIATRLGISISAASRRVGEAVERVGLITREGVTGDGS